MKFFRHTSLEIVDRFRACIISDRAASACCAVFHLDGGVNFPIVNPVEMISLELAPLASSLPPQLTFEEHTLPIWIISDNFKTRRNEIGVDDKGGS